ncbi:MAG TPA: TIGR03067 domain-containing protein [Gemmataceae bacterium]|jgi:uncharacterized protein (TIGR03067 family)|nr:TIGR03067 domain-containing protein [Gemmataceae bacterium]
MRRFALLAVTLGLVAAAPAPEKKDDLKKFEGAWAFTGWEMGGQQLPEETLRDTKWSVKGNKYTFEMGSVTEEGTLKLDAGKKPAALDLTITAGTDKGKVQLGIYRVERDAIVFCLAPAGAKERPTEFASPEGSSNMLLTIKRVKKDD